MGRPRVDIKNDYLTQITEPSNYASAGCGRGFTDKGAGSCTGQGQTAIYLKLYVSEL